MKQEELNKRRGKINQYIVFNDELNVRQSGLENLEIGSRFVHEDNSDIVFEVVKIHKILYLNQEFIFVNEL